MFFLKLTQAKTNGTNVWVCLYMHVFPPKIWDYLNGLAISLPRPRTINDII